MTPTTTTVHGFGRCDIGTSLVYKPTSIADVNQVYQIARDSHGQQRIVIRGGGHSFDGQALHKDDDGKQIILSNENYEPDKIEFSADGSTVTLGSGVCWGKFVKQVIDDSQAHGTPIRIPGSMQTGMRSTVAGTLAGDCLSRFSGVGGKESAWIDSFKILTPNDQTAQTVYPGTDLFNAVVGGHGYIGFVTEATYRLISIPAGSVVHTKVTRSRGLNGLIDRQNKLVKVTTPLRAISSAWFTHDALLKKLKLDLPPVGPIKGAVFESSFAQPTLPAKPDFPLYHGLYDEERFVIEVAARTPWVNWAVHEGLFVLVTSVSDFEDNLEEFLFFMDGDTIARERYEKAFGKPFPLVQQTYVIPTKNAKKFAKDSEQAIRDSGLDPTESDMLFIKADDCLMSANYQMDGYAITYAFEPTDPEQCTPEALDCLLKNLSVTCQKAGGRIHLPKNSHVAPEVFRAMFSPQIEDFEKIKRQYDPDKIIGNKFSDKFFQF